MLGTTAVSGARELLTVGLVGGASSGKSTLLNNLVGRVISDVAIRAHTTEGPIVAACPDQIDVIRTHVRERGWLLRGADVREASDAPVTGSGDAITLVRVDFPAARGGESKPVLVDTPDFTSLAARDSGDLTRAMLPWMDRVVVTIDEDRWFDEQVFGWLRRRLDELAIERLVVFNRCQRGGEIALPYVDRDQPPGETVVGSADEDRLKDRARLFAAEHVVMPFAPGRGPASLSPERLRLIQDWLARPRDAHQQRRRFEALTAFVGRAARRVTVENARRAGLHAELAESLKHEAAALAPDERVLAFEVLLSPEQRRQLDPVYQAIVRPVEWAGRWSRRITGGLASIRDVEGREEHETIGVRGRAFFLAERARMVDRLGTVARRSELCVLAGGAAQFEREVSAAEAEDEAATLSRGCERAYDAFIERLEAEAKNVRLGPVSSGGALAGAVIGGVLAAAPGGVLMPVGAAIGAAVGGITSAAGARSAWRVVRLMMRTPELRELWNAVRAYRQGLLTAAERERERLLAAAAVAFIPTGDPLERSFTRLAAVGGGGA